MRGRISQYGKNRTRAASARDFARQLRKQSTDAERRLWRLLRGRRFSDFKFRRQYACGIYFLDFYCIAAKLAVELDGGGHGFPDQRARDEKRNRFLAEREIKVLRFWNHQMHGELDAIRFEIWHALMERTGQEIANYLSKPAPSPRSSPPRGGEEVWADARFGEETTMSIRLYLPVRAPSPQSSPPRGRGSLGGRAIRRGNGHEHSALLTCARPLTSILSPEGERKFGRTLNLVRQ